MSFHSGSKNHGNNKFSGGGKKPSFGNGSQNGGGNKNNNSNASRLNQSQQQQQPPVFTPKRGDFFNDRSAELEQIAAKQKAVGDNNSNSNSGEGAMMMPTESARTEAAQKAKEAEHAKNVLLNAAAGNAVGVGGGVMGQLITRRVQYIKYRKPHTIEYPPNAIVLNPKHAQNVHDTVRGANVAEGHGSTGSGKGAAEPASPTNTAHTFSRPNRAAHHEDCNDDPRQRELPEVLCSEEVFHRNLSLAWRSVGSGCGAGLINCGNTCFANAVLQCFAFTPPFAQFLMQNFAKANQGPDVPFDYAYALAETLRQIHSSGGGQAKGRGGGAIKPGLIIGNLKGIHKGLVLGRQCDSFEFAQQLITKVQESVLRRLVGTRKVPFIVQYTTPFMRVAGGYERSQVSWSKEDEIQQLKKANNKAAAADLAMDKALVGDKLVSNTYEHFTMLTLAVVAGNTLEACLADNYKREKLDGRIYQTERKVKVIAHRQVSIHIPPPSLMIHLKRFDNKRNKINKPITFPKTLNILPHCSSNSDVKEALYDLCAVTVHIGGAINYGHYVAYVKGKNGLWYLCDDESVRQVGEAEVLKAQALILYYCMRESTFKKLTTPTPLLGPKKGNGAEPSMLSLASDNNNNNKPAVDEGKELSEEAIQKAMRAAREKMLKEAAAKERDELPTDSSSSSSSEEEENSDEAEEEEEEQKASAAPQRAKPSAPISSASKSASSSSANEKNVKKSSTNTAAASVAAVPQQPITKKAAALFKEKAVSNVYSNNSDDDDDGYGEGGGGDDDGSDDEANEDEDGEDDSGDDSNDGDDGDVDEEDDDNDEDNDDSAAKKSSSLPPLVTEADIAAIAAKAKTITVTKGPLPKGLGKFAGLMGAIRNQQLIQKAEAEEEKAEAEAEAAAAAAAAADSASKEVQKVSSSSSSSSSLKVNVFAPKTIVRSAEEVRKMRIKRIRDDDEEEEDADEKQTTASNSSNKNNNNKDDGEGEEELETVPFSREAYTKALSGGEGAGLSIERKRYEGMFKTNQRDEEWERAFDTGKMKKVRTEQRARSDDKFCKANAFQVAQNQKERGEFVPKYRPTDEEKKAARYEARRGGGGGGSFGRGGGGGYAHNGGRGGGGYGGNVGYGEGNGYQQQGSRPSGSRRISFE